MLLNLQYTMIICKICGESMHVSKIQEHLLEKHQMYYAGYTETVDTSNIEVPVWEGKEKIKKSNKKKE